MKFNHRRGVSPIIATLLLIAIAVASGIIVYVYVNSLAGGLTSGGGAQVSSQLQLQAYNFVGISGTSTTSNGVVADVFLENTGSSSLTISSVYFDGTALTQWFTAAGPAYKQYLLVPTSGGNCFAVVPTSTALAPYTLATPVDTSGATAACGTETPAAATCSTVICLNTASAQTPTLTLAAQSTNQIVIGLNAAVTSGTSHQVKIVSSNGGVSIFTIIAGGTG
jgi:archaeal type IV pilus assembly protein PilA